MNFPKLVASLRSFAQLLPIQVGGVSEEDARWRPPSQNWSILEIVSHLVDEEQEDFPLRLKMTLENPEKRWPSINPEVSAVERNYNEMKLERKVREFCDLRKSSVEWLESLESPRWDTTYQHPHLGGLRAGDILAAWVAHDQLHVRQIAKRKYELIRRDAGEFLIDYAGEWTA